MPTPSIVVLEGLFYELPYKGGPQVAVLMGGDPSLVGRALTPFVGRVGNLSLHHMPPNPPLPHEPGFGSCFWAGHCPSGHKQDPTWMFSMNLTGVVEQLPDGSWTVGGVPLPLSSKMIGHQGRLVLFIEGEVDQEASTSDLLREAESLITTLQGLKKALEDE